LLPSGHVSDRTWRAPVVQRHSKRLYPIDALSYPKLKAIGRRSKSIKDQAADDRHPWAKRKKKHYTQYCGQYSLD
jgi:hypothetical protein